MVQRVIAIGKSICIVALAVLAIYQISQLWFVNLTNRNFFLYLEARFPPAVPAGESAWAQPFRIIYGAGDGRFNIRYNGIANSNAWGFGENALDAILRNGNFVGSSAINHYRLQERPVLIYEYHFNMNADTFAMAMGRRNGAALTSHGITTFNAIAVQPPTTTDSLLRVFFMDDTYAWEFTLSPGTRRHPAEDFVFSMPHISHTEKHFIAVGNSFAPYAPDGFLYWLARAYNPHLSVYGHLYMSTIRPQIEVFFSSPATINPIIGVGEIYTFTSHNTMVRYLPFDVLEYTSSRSIGRTAPGNLLSDFSAARAFIAHDHNVENEIFLIDYDPSGTAHIFWFGYVIDNFPMFLSEPWHTEPDCRDPLIAPIEIVVDHGRVVRYRRLAYNFVQGELLWFDPERLNIGEPFILGFPISREPVIELEIFQRGEQ